MNKCVVLVTGASTGIGHLTARALAARGHVEFGAAAVSLADRFIDDGAGAMTEVAERVREEFAARIGIADLLVPAIRA